MSAQAGVWNFDGAPASRQILANISQTISQYGPDGERSYFSGPIGMLYRSFHTTKESRLERQPHISSRGNTIMWDGLLDNREELIPQLRDDLSSEQTDLAIVIAAFERWGTDCLRKLTGDWALSIWDPIERTLILARDYIGVRHLYYHPTHKRVIWCSHLVPLVLSGDRFNLNDEYVAGYLALYPEAHLTPYREIHAVPPGKFVLIREGKTTIHPYWTFDPKLNIRYKTDAEYEEHFRQIFRQAVRRRLRSNSPVLAELSGGLDSSSVVCMADDILAKEGAETPRLDTLSYYSLKEPQGDDWLYFTKIEQKRGRTGFHIDTDKYESSISFGSRALTAVPGCLVGAEELGAERRKITQGGGYRVTLSGIGGDEFLGGVPNPLPQLADLLLTLRFVELTKQLTAWSFAKKRPWIQLLLQAAALSLPLFPGLELLKRLRIEPWIDRRFARQQRIADRRLGPQHRLGFWLPSRCSYARTLVVMSWQMSVASPAPGGCEQKRYPFLDQNLIEFVLSIPATQILRPSERRSLMRRALACLLPPEVLSRRTKGLAARSLMGALNRQWPDFKNLFESPVCGHLKYIDSTLLNEELRQLREGKPDQLVQLLKAISLELWLRQLDARGLLCKTRSGVPVCSRGPAVQTAASLRG